MTILEKLQNSKEFTNVEQEVVAYILANKDTIIDLTILELANVTFTSNATIIRLCKKLGLKGFREFKLQLIKELERARKHQREVDMDYPFDPDQTSQEIIKTMADLTKESIDVSYESIDYHELEETIEIILQAQRVYLYGIGDSLINAIGFSNRLVKLKIPAIIANMYGEQTTHLDSMKSGDVGIFVSYSGNINNPISSIVQAKRRGCKFIMITSKQPSGHFDCTITFPSKESIDDKVATYYSQITINFIFNCLYALLFTKK